MGILNRIWAIGLLLGIAGHSTSVMAEYQSEISYKNIQTEYDDRSKLVYNELLYKYHYNKVQDNTNPLAEASYINRAGSMNIFFTRSTFEDPVGPELDTDGLGFGFTKMEPDSPYVFELGYYNSETEVRMGVIFFGKTEDTYLTVGAGLFVYKHTLFNLKYVVHEVKYPGSGITENEYKLNDISVYFKTILFGEDNDAINFEAIIGQKEYLDEERNVISNEYYKAYADYYIGRRISIGGGYEYETGKYEGAVGSNKIVRGRFFLTDSFSLSVEFEKRTRDYELPSDSDSTELKVNYRF